MKKISAIAALAALGTITCSAHAYFPRDRFEAACSLSAPTYVPSTNPGNAFEFTVQLDVYNWGVYFNFDEFDVRPPFFGTFYGTRDGVDDIPGGYMDPREIGAGTNTLNGYANPGGISGNYQRYMVVTDTFGNFVCITNTVSVQLQ